MASNNFMKQKIINMDKQLNACSYIRNTFPEKIINLSDLIQKINNLRSNDVDILEFHSFLETLATEKYETQRNNHNLMKTFLKEKITSHNRIQYNLLSEIHSKGKSPYAKNLAPAKIMSNYFLSNETEGLLNVTTLERAFQTFTWGERSYLSDQDEFMTVAGIQTKINNTLTHNDEIENIRKYFALQLTRREFYLYELLKKCLIRLKKTISEMDLLDYLYCKYIYNKSLVENFNNWYTFLKGKNKIYQLKYVECTKKITYKASRKMTQPLNPTEYTNSNLAITENHTFIVSELIDIITVKRINTSLQLNGFLNITKDELTRTTEMLVTIGSDDKLCYLMTRSLDLSFFEKIDFIVHAFWDQAMMNVVLLNLLLAKNSKLNSLPVFKNAQISKFILNRAIFMHDIFQRSIEFEELIKNKSP